MFQKGFFTQFLWTCPQKNICIANWLLLLKKDFKIKAERIRNHWRQERVEFQKTFWISPRKAGNFEGIVYFLCLVNEISRKSFPNNYCSVEAKFILSIETWKTVNEFPFCLLIGQIGSSFFCGRNVSWLNCIFLPLTDGWFCSPPLGNWYFKWGKWKIFREPILRFAHNVWFEIFTFFNQNNQFASN